MNTTQTLSAERIAEIKAFKTTDFTDCPIQSAEELAQFKPKHPENFTSMAQVRLDTDVLPWVMTFGKEYQKQVNTILREAMLQQVG
jgi:uncharacterized protein (DUF4415 family)